MANKQLDLIGSVFGELTIISQEGKSKSGNIMWGCVCSCGNEIVRPGTTIKRGGVRSCGHLLLAKRGTRVGEKHDSLTVISEVSGAPKYEVQVQCDCGNIIVSRYGSVTGGKVKSCRPCARRISSAARASQRIPRDYRTHCSYRAMVARCGNPKHGAYGNYGGRGIDVCARWVNSPDQFEIDMGIRPEGMTLERHNNQLGYSPENCRWATMKEQIRNTRVNVNITIDGETRCVSDWSEVMGIPAPRIYARVNRTGKENTALWLKNGGIYRARI